MAKRKKKTQKKMRELRKIEKKEETKYFELPENHESQEDEEVLLPPRKYLILCEGETEHTYFEGIQFNEILKKKLLAVTVDIFSPKDKGITFTSLKGLVYEAMKRKRKAEEDEVPYDEIWLITDNDERNSFIITKNKLGNPPYSEPLDQKNNPVWIKLKEYDKKSFLHKKEYDTFLKIFFEEEGIRQIIIDKTDKHNQFDELENPDPKTMFFSGDNFTYSKGTVENYDENWKNYVNVGYSARSIENWLILHFERCDTCFSSSDGTKNDEDSIHYIRNKGFIPEYRKGSENETESKIGAYQGLKNTPFSPALTEARIVIDRLRTASENAIWLRNIQQDEVAKSQLKYYEIDPYILKLDSLVGSLIGEKLHSISEWNSKDEQLCIIHHIGFDLEQNTAIIVFQPDERILINSGNISNYLRLFEIEKGLRKELSAKGLTTGLINQLPSDGICEITVQFEKLNTSTDYCLHFKPKQDKEFTVIYPFST